MIVKGRSAAARNRWRLAARVLALETLSHFDLQDGDITKWEEKMVAALPSLELEKDRLALSAYFLQQPRIRWALAACAALMRLPVEKVALSSGCSSPAW